MRPVSSLLAAVVLAAMSVSQAAAACAEDRVEIRGEFGTVRFRVVVADTPQERAQGLMRVPEMPRMAGMLFVYERPESVAFWMENTLIPLDMIFADETGTVRRIHENAIPLDRTPIPGGDGIQYVLEINGGMSEALGLSVGNEMRHPAMTQDLASWPCAAD
ncbi:DUF192 domain-containing protein [Rhodobacterales bacterium HKCCSP123]|nr:DUF192 domain-containing protein [Rhodobacterales bacterium HKCCSP123]